MRPDVERRRASPAAGQTPFTRLFVALPTDPATATALCALYDACRGDDRARAVAPDRVHLTLHFLGPVARERVPALAAALAVPFDGFALAFDRCERWPTGLVVARPLEVPAALVRLHAALGDALRNQGIATDEARGFKPHVTLARRHQRPLAAAGERREAAVVRWAVGGCALFESVGGVYRVLQGWP